MLQNDIFSVNVFVIIYIASYYSYLELLIFVLQIVNGQN